MDTEAVKAATLNLWRRWKVTGDAREAEKIFTEALELNAGLVEFATRKYIHNASTAYTVEDMRADAAHGFLLAWQAFDPAAGTALSAYIVRQIGWRICESLRRMEAVHVSDELRRQYRDARRRGEKLTPALQTVGRALSVVSLDAILPGTDDLSLAEKIADDDKGLADFAHDDTMAYVRRVLEEEAGIMEEEVLKYFFGMGRQRLNKLQIARLMGASRPTALDFFQAALTRLGKNNRLRNAFREMTA